jgi:outer membrane protein assembly factor BamA
MMLVGGSVTLHAQGADTTAGETRPQPGNTLVPLPVVFYQPETGTGFGAVAAYYMYGDVSSTERVLPSTLWLLAVYTTKRQVSLELGAELYHRHGKYRTVATVGFSEFPTKFWGTGNAVPEEQEEDYTPRTFYGAGEFQWSVAPGWYVGAAVEVGHRQLVTVDSAGLLDQGIAPGTADGRLVGAGLLFSRDTRDNSVNPTRGSYHQLRTMGYDDLIASEFDFWMVTLDLRKYVPLESGPVLAFRALGAAASAATPFDRLPQLGGDVLLRGYYEGRFRDRSLVALQTELRAHVWWRIGVVAFAGVGQVATTPSNLELDGFKPSLGAGLRFALSPDAGLNIRADYGWGFDVGSGGLYLNIGEAF